MNPALKNAIQIIEDQREEISRLKRALRDLMEWHDYNDRGEHPYLYQRAWLNAKEAIGDDDEWLNY